MRTHPPPRLHRHRYQGVLAPNAPLRAAATAYGRGAYLLDKHNDHGDARHPGK